MNYNSKIYIWTFLIALSVRFLFIVCTPDKTRETDLHIYRDAGQLVVNGVNPYNFNDNINLRQQLRTDSDNFDEYVCSDQEKWDYYSSSNLPLATLLFGGIEYCFRSPNAYRYFFSFFDSLLAVVIMAFVINKWNYKIPDRIRSLLPAKLQQHFPLLIGLSLGALSPVLFLWGTYIPEPKGTGLFLILSAIYFSTSSNRKLSMIVSPALLGFSVAFIGLGAFIAPLCLYYACNNNEQKIGSIALYIFISLLVCVLCLAPFLSELIEMMSRRMTLAVDDIPQHGSMWAVISKILPTTWLIIKKIFMVLFAGISIIGFLKKRLNVTVLSANLLFLFTSIYLMNGSMDRMNISIVTLIILLGFSNLFRMTTLLWFVYLVYGFFSCLYSYFLGLRQDFDGIFVLLFSILYFVLLIIQTFAKKSSYYETIGSYSGS